jgi:hypothetical protein
MGKDTMYKENVPPFKLKKPWIMLESGRFIFTSNIIKFQ